MGGSINRGVRNSDKLYSVRTINIERSSSTQFEDLPNEILLEIFDLLDMYDIYNVFSYLNSRFLKLIHDSTYPLDINMSFLSQVNFQRYYNNFIRWNKHQIRSLHLFNSFMFNLIFSSVKNTEEFIQLETLVIDNVISSDSLLRLMSLPNLTSLIIHQSDHTVMEEFYFYPIVRLPVLKYCKLSFKARISFECLSNNFNESNRMEHLIINNEFDLIELPKLVSYLPCVHHLSIDNLYYFHRFGIPTFFNGWNSLTHVSLNLNKIKFNQFEPFIVNLFHHLQVLQISTDYDKEYLNAFRWERIISFHMKYLRIFDIQHLYSTRDFSEDYIHDHLIEQFKSSFWIERQWYFGYQHSMENRSRYGLFYSIQPYRRRNYVLYGKHYPVINDCRSVRHVHIQNQLSMNDCSLFFPNAVELTIDRVFFEWNTSEFERIVSFEKLRKIILNFNHLNIHSLVRILYLTPNCSQLILSFTPSDEIDSMSIQNKRIFRLISMMNRIKDITVKSTCPFKWMKLLVMLCPRLEHLTIRVLKKDLTFTIEYLLEHSNKYTHHLASLCIQSTDDIDLPKLINQLRVLKQSDEFAVQDITKNICHIWW